MAESEMDAIELLITQHEQIKDMFIQLSTAQGDQKKELFADLVRMLAMHESAEEEVVHPLARRKLDDGDDIIESRLEEEAQAKQALADLYDMGVDDPMFDEMLAELAADVLAHAQAEETEEFLELRTMLSPEQLEQMAMAIRAAEEIAPARPHPAMGEAATADMMAGTPMAMFDQMRSAVRGWSSSHD